MRGKEGILLDIIASLRVVLEYIEGMAIEEVIYEGDDAVVGGHAGVQQVWQEVKESLEQWSQGLTGSTSIEGAFDQLSKALEAMATQPIRKKS